MSAIGVADMRNEERLGYHKYTGKETNDGQSDGNRYHSSL